MKHNIDHYGLLKTELRILLEERRIEAVCVATEDYYFTYTFEECPCCGELGLLIEKEDKYE